ncbi:MAG: NAD(P)H-hydrate dehydratase [Muribaculum sp.]|nr:NAD(P)H-hydrate dehydratase [Muribaculaceae bacterium]MCM1080946.1 NAD(P)H-hydrate dehydratase [Muribaculum sp.]
MKLFTNDQIRSIERQVIKNEGVTTIELVERAASAISWEIMSRWRQSKKVLIFAGPGNNGADALAVASMLIEEGYTVEALLFNIFDKLSEACIHYRDKLKEMSPTSLTEITSDFTPPFISTDILVIDGLFGSGLKEPLTGGFQSLVDYINNSSATIISIDIPSGMFAEWNDRILSRNAIHATLTLAIEFPRLAFFIPDNAEFLGEWKVLDIKLASAEVRTEKSPYFLLEKADAHRLIRRRNKFTSKSDYGSCLLAAGSYGMMGAAVMAARGALRAGVGRITVHSPRCGFNALQTGLPEAMFEHDSNDIVITNITLKHDYNVIAVGPGIGTHEYTVRAVEALISAAQKPLVIDADALNCIAQRPSMLDHIPPMSVITPHSGEFDRLFGAHTSHELRLKKAIEKAKYYNIIILLKGYYTTVIRPDGKIYFLNNGTPAMATPGSGDVLTGIISALMAQGYSPDISAALGAFIHSQAGTIAAAEHGEYGVLASDIANATGKAIKIIMDNN